MESSIKEEQWVYVCLPLDYDEGNHILSWTLSHFPKDETKIVIFPIFPTASFNRSHRKEILDKYQTQCATHKFKAEILMHTNDDPVKGILEQIDSKVIKNLVISALARPCYTAEDNSSTIHQGIIRLNLQFVANLGIFLPEHINTIYDCYSVIDFFGFNMADFWHFFKCSKISAFVAEKANPSCKIWFIHKGNLQFTRYPKSDLPETPSEQRREKLHQKEIEVIQKRENDKNNLLKRENEQLKFENQLLRNQPNDNLIRLEDLAKQNQELKKRISNLKIDYNKLKQECDNAIKEAQELRKQKHYSFANSDIALSFEFSLSELEQATQNFSDSLMIGEGGFGCVYKGSLRKTTVAIKKLNSYSLQGSSEFQQEVAILSRVRHPNIVSLIGSCSEISTLVYEFLPNGNLEDWLTCADNTSSLTWQVRTRIISEICLGLLFLHSSKPHLVIHGDLKPENILLDANFISKISDFGISQIIHQSETNTTAFYQTNNPKGTIAYMDPEYLATGELTPKSDVYSFGLILLRLLTGKHRFNIANEVGEDMEAGRLMSIVDKCAGEWPLDLAKNLAKLGLRCAEISRKKRPDMSQVWATIEPLVKAASQSKALSFFESSTFNEEHVPSHFICPIMQDIMMDPYIAADGFTYEAEAMKSRLNAGHNTSPMTNLVLPHHDLIPNHVLRYAIQEWRATRL